MKKRTFIKTTGTLMAGSMVAPLTSCSNSSSKVERESPKPLRTNWAGNLQYQAKDYYESDSVEQVQQLVKKCDHLRALGTRHCFNHIADTKYHQLSTRALNKVISIDDDTQTVTVEAGASYGQLCADLHDQGYALHNLASLPHISIAGACATATHGSGINNGNLGSAVTAMEFVNAAGELVNLSKTMDSDKLNGAIVHLGGLGVVTKITLAIQPTFEVRQDVYQFLPVSELLANFDEIMGSGYSVSLFTDYQAESVNQVWVKSKLDPQGEITADKEFFGAVKAMRNLHPILELDAANCTDQMGVPGPWFDRLPHFKMDFTPSSGKELHAEYFVPREQAAEVYGVVLDIKDTISPWLMISEVRTIAADDQWMSPCYQQDCVAFHFTCEQDWEGLKKVLPVIEEELEPFQVRPHWGKMFTMKPERLQSLYSRLGDFKSLLADYDPEGKFRNEFLQQFLYT